MDIARTVAVWRRRAGLTQEELARRLHTSQANLWRIERGTQTPRVDTLESILEACGAELMVGTRRPHARLPGDLELDRGQLEVLHRLAFRRVDCVVIGPLAERLRGAPTPSRRVEIVALPAPVTRRKLVLVRRDLRLPLRRSAPLVVRYRPPPPFLGLWELRRAASTIHGVLVAALDHLIEMRTTPSRSEARAALGFLMELRRASEAQRYRPEPGSSRSVATAWISRSRTST